MESVSQAQANHYFAMNHFLAKAQQTCTDKCVVDFQIKDLTAMERECANACIQKHMVIFKDVAKFWEENWQLINI